MQRRRPQILGEAHHLVQLVRVVSGDGHVYLERDALGPKRLDAGHSRSERSRQPAEGIVGGLIRPIQRDAHPIDAALPDALGQILVDQGPVGRQGDDQAPSRWRSS